jgi:hypothetical protein
MSHELKKINELYDIILSNKKIIHEQITSGATNMFGDSKVVLDKTSEGAIPPSGWKPGYKFIIQNPTNVFSPVEGTVEQVTSNNGKYYVYLSSNGNQIYIGNLNSSDLSRGTKLNVGNKIGNVNSGSFVYVASNPKSISEIVDSSGNMSSGKNDIFSDNNKGVNLTAKMIGKSIRDGDLQVIQTESLNKNKKLIYEITVKPSEVGGNYPNIIFADRTKNDDISKALLDDINSAAASIGATVTVDFAQTDHKKFTSTGTITRHWRNSAVDIDSIIIGGKKYEVSLANRNIVEKFTNVLLNSGYMLNSETKSNPKAVLSFGATGHDTHIHVSNLADASSIIPGVDDIDDDDNVETVLDKTVFKGMSPLEKAEAIKKLKDAGLLVGMAGAGAAVVSLLPNIFKFLKGGTEKITNDSSYGGSQQVNRTAKYIGNLIRAAIPI